MKRTDRKRAVARDEIPELVFSAQIGAATEEGGGPRRIEGTAYSGGMIAGHWAWGDIVFDLSSMTLPERLPLLVDHDRSQRAGVVDQFNLSNETGLTVSGYLLENDSGRAVAADADAGFPWQMSVHVEPGKIDEEKGATVNGKHYAGKVTVFRNSTIREVSFTPTGADSNTAAQVFNHQLNHEDNRMTIDDLKQQLETVKGERDTARAEAKQFKTERDEANDALSQRINAERKQQFSAVMGSDPSEEDMKLIADMTESQFSLLLKKPAPVSHSQNSHLFGEQATNGDTTAKNPLLEA